jgi:orotidine-5'-phosphate decarboxylase
MIKEVFGPDFVAVTPGIRPEWGSGTKDDQRRIVTPAEAVRRGADFLVIGRPIRDAEDPAAAAQYIAEEIEFSLGES